jgi:transposase InsO family protein
VREGWALNHKRIQRMYREEGLAVRRRRRGSPESLVVDNGPVFASRALGTTSH